MDLTQLANLGEFIGGVAVLVTLVFLVFQIRSNSRLLEVQTLQASAAGRQRISLAFLGPHADETIVKMYSEDRSAELDISDWTTAEAYFESFLSMAQCDYLVGGQSESFTEYWEASLTTLRYVTSTPHFLVWWNSVGRGIYTERFAALVETLAKQQPVDTSYATRVRQALEGKTEASPS